MRLALIYSRQPGNPYKGGSNENAQMFALAQQLGPKLQAGGHDVEWPPNTDYNGSGSLSYADNVAWVNDRHNVKPFDLLISLHSNAMGDSCILYGTSTTSRRWAERFQAQLNADNFMMGGDKWEFNERKVSEVSDTAPPAILLENGRHDTDAYSAWLKTNIANGNLANWLSNSILKVIGGGGSTPTNPTPDLGGWNTHKKRLAAKVIGTVESNLTWDAINYRDPITVGAYQWYGLRAAQILNRMKNENPSSWVGVNSKLATDLASQTSWDWWTGRYLTTTEGNSIKPVLRANTLIQNDQMVKDLEAYRVAYSNLGGDPHSNTDAMIFFMSMYHQRPASARSVLKAAGANSDVRRLHSYALRDAKFSQFKGRYDKTLNIILSNDPSGVNLGIETPNDPDPDAPDEPGDSEYPNDVRLDVDVSQIRRHGNNLILSFRDGGSVTCPPVRNGVWNVPGGVGTPNVPGVTPGDDPSPPPVTPAATMGQKVVEWMIANQEKWAYGQGAGRTNPWVSGYTDCSACIYLAYKAVGNLNIGTYTTAQSVGVSGFTPPGRVITTDRETIRAGVGLLPGDLIFYRNYVRAGWPYNHVEVYTGDAQRRTIGQVGSTAPGPSLHPMNRYLDWGKLAVLVRRPSET